tara:strand:- start:376 stop:1083 length:708 start_codon:yes stop_codon:yes gene_type:complete
MKTAVITGVGSGIGKATCLHFLSQNWCVIGILRNEEQLNRLNELALDLPGKLHLVKVDLALEDFQKTVGLELNKLKIQSIDALLNIAGLLNPQSFGDMRMDYLNKVMEINFIAPVLLIQELIPLLSNEEGGNVVNITSMSGFQGSVRFPGLSAYGASKAALSSFSESIAIELEEDNVIVNALAIGSVNTNMLKKAFPDFHSSIEPHQMAEYIYSFANHGYRFYNGKTLAVAITNP